MPGSGPGHRVEHFDGDEAAGWLEESLAVLEFVELPLHFEEFRVDAGAVRECGEEARRTARGGHASWVRATDGETEK